MLRYALAFALGLAVAFSGTTARAEEKKAETKKLEGTLTCTKCALKETKECGHALIVKEGGKDVKYYLVDKGGKEPYHKECCTEDVKATVTGKIVEKDGKKWIEDAKVTVLKK